MISFGRAFAGELVTTATIAAPARHPLLCSRKLAKDLVTIPSRLPGFRVDSQDWNVVAAAFNSLPNFVLLSHAQPDGHAGYAAGRQEGSNRTNQYAVLAMLP
jgi:hypothetical protein